MAADTLRGVEALYRVVEFIKNELATNPYCNNVTVGTLTEIDLQKNTIFPLSHITLENITHGENTLTFSLTIFNLDIVNISKDIPLDQTYFNDDLMYIATNQLYVINRLVARIRQSTIYANGWQLEGNPQSDFINKELENMLAGYQTTIQLTVPNDIDKC